MKKRFYVLGKWDTAALATAWKCVCAKMNYENPKSQPEIVK
jgi:hypothetical protein